MRTALTAEQAALRDDFAAYFRRLITPEIRDALRSYGATPVYKQVIRQMGRDGMLAVGWPKEHGGRGYGPLEQMIFVREALRAHAPIPFVTLSTVGPTLMAHGSAAQKARFLPDIAAGIVHLAIGYTEPQSGTDLASLRTRAVDHGDHFVVNGSKIYTSHVEGADWIWLAVRTGPEVPKHKGISILLVETTSPGFSFTPIETVAGMRTNTTYYSDVRVPRENLVGEVNGGWRLITSQLNHERIGIAGRGILGEELHARVLAWARQADARGRRPIEDAGVRRLLAACHARLDLLRLLNYRLAWSLAEAQPDAGFTSAAKAHGVDLLVAICRDLLQVLGFAGLVRHGSEAALLQGDVEAEYRKCQNATFGGGSAEVMREIVAQAALGLPRTTR
jgi:alkylation response protein AidB-like acyl-CoA dehydrogenase